MHVACGRIASIPPRGTCAPHAAKALGKGQECKFLPGWGWDSIESAYYALANGKLQMGGGLHAIL